MSNQALNWTSCVLSVAAAGGCVFAAAMYASWAPSVCYGACAAIWLVSAGLAASSARTWRRVEEMS